MFFFFQAEDGIRDGHVTGVQTCALPIYSSLDVHYMGLKENGDICLTGRGRMVNVDTTTGKAVPLTKDRKSVRVGKECRSRWTEDRYKEEKKRGMSEERE